MWGVAKLIGRKKAQPFQSEARRALVETYRVAKPPRKTSWGCYVISLKKLTKINTMHTVLKPGLNRKTTHIIKHTIEICTQRFEY